MFLTNIIVNNFFNSMLPSSNLDSYDIVTGKIKYN